MVYQKKTSAEDRSEIARRAASARWGKRKRWEIEALETCLVVRVVEAPTLTEALNLVEGAKVLSRGPARREVITIKEAAKC